MFFNFGGNKVKDAPGNPMNVFFSFCGNKGKDAPGNPMNVFFLILVEIKVKMLLGIP